MQSKTLLAFFISIAFSDFIFAQTKISEAEIRVSREKFVEELNDIKIDYENLYDEYKNNLNIVNNLNIELDKLLKKYDDLYLEYKNKIDKKENEHTSSTIFDGKNKKKTYSYNKIQDVYINSEDGEIYKTISKYSVLIENEIESIPTKLSEKDEKIS